MARKPFKITDRAAELAALDEATTRGWSGLAVIQDLLADRATLLDALRRAEAALEAAESGFAAVADVGDLGAAFAPVVRGQKATIDALADLRALLAAEGKR